MSHQTPNSLKSMLLKGQIAGLTDTFKLIYLQAGFTFDRDNHHSYADVLASECLTASGYTVGGITLTSNAIATNDTEDRSELTFDDVDFAVTGTAFISSGAIIFDDDTATAGDDYTDAICVYLDAGGAKTTAVGGHVTGTNLMVTLGDK